MKKKALNVKTNQVKKWPRRAKYVLMKLGKKIITEDKK